MEQCPPTIINTIFLEFFPDLLNGFLQLFSRSSFHHLPELLDVKSLFDAARFRILRRQLRLTTHYAKFGKKPGIGGSLLFHFFL